MHNVCLRACMQSCMHVSICMYKSKSYVCTCMLFVCMKICMYVRMYVSSYA